MANKPSFAQALRIAKQVKLGLASAGDGQFVKMTAHDRRKLYIRATDLQGKTINEQKGHNDYNKWLIKQILGE